MDLRKVGFRLALGLSLFISLSSGAQQSRTLFFMHDLAQSSYVNPAIQPGCQWYFGLPILSSLYVNASSTGFSYDDLSPGDEYIDAEAIARKLHGIDFFTAELHMNIFAMGFKRNDFYYSFNIAEKIDAKAFYPKNIVDIAVYGNKNLVGKTMFTKGLGASAIHYREYSFGIAQNFESYFLWGLKGKLLFGKANLATRHGAISLTTEENTYDLQAEWSYQLNTSFPLDIPATTSNMDLESITVADIDPLKYLFNNKNMGFAIDYGFVYIDDQITWSGSILDFGFVNWRSETHKFNNNGSVAFEGITVDDILNPDEFLDMIRDSIDNQTRVYHTEGQYFTMLPTKVNLGATYNFLPNINVGALIRTEFYPRRPVPSLTLSLNTINIKNIAASISYSIMNGSYGNIGVGLGFGFQNFVFHIISDNTLGFFIPHKVHTANLRFGMHLLLGCSEKSRRIPYRGPGCYWDPNETKHKK